MSTLATVKGEVRRLLADFNESARAHADGDGLTKQFPLPDANLLGRTILGAFTLTAVEQASTDVSSPPERSLVVISGNVPGITGNVVVTGTNWLGSDVSDSIALSGTTEVAGTTYFNTITGVSLPALTHAGDIVRVFSDHSVTVTIDLSAIAEDHATYPWVVDFDNGRVLFTSTAPPSGTKNVVWEYIYTLYNSADILSAINNAVADIWAEIPRAKMDTTSVVPASNTYEYALPADCHRLIRVESRSSSSSPYELENSWRVVENGGTRYLKMFSSPSTGDTIRLHYVPEPTSFSDDLDTLATIGFPERAKWALIYLSCAYLCSQKLLPRARTNQFKNAEGVNVPKIYEVQRIAADFRALAEVEMRKLRLGAKRWS